MAFEAVLGSLATVTSISLNCAPFLDDIPAIQKQRTTGDRSPAVYVAIWANSCLWVCYGIAVKAFHPISTTNLVGLATGSYFLFVYYEYCPASQRAAFYRALSAALSLVTLVYMYTFVFPDSPRMTQFKLGLACCTITVGLYASPVGTVYRALQRKAPGMISLPFVMVAAVNGMLWSLFGLLKEDPWVYCPNIIGAFLSVTQMCAWYHLTSCPTSPSLHGKGIPRFVSSSTSSSAGLSNRATKPSLDSTEL